MILPAFGVTVGDMAQLVDQGCTLVDTTCGSVLNVWKNVVRYAQDGFTAVIHGKVKHEETRATASQALQVSRSGRFLVVLDREEAGVVCDYIRHGGDAAAFLARFGDAVSPGFDPDRDLVRIGCANQTTMLMTESLEIGEMLRAAMTDRYGADGPRPPLPGIRHHLQRHAGASGRRPRAPRAERLDLMLVVGGYNSSNTCNLARICAERVTDLPHRRPRMPGVGRAKSAIARSGAPSTTVRAEDVSHHWLPGTSPLTIGLTAGASTPNNIVGEVIERLARFAGA